MEYPKGESRLCEPLAQPNKSSNAVKQTEVGASNGTSSLIEGAPNGSETEPSATSRPRPRPLPKTNFPASTSPSSDSPSQCVTAVASVGASVAATADLTSVATESTADSALTADFSFPDAVPVWIKQHAERLLKYEVVEEHRAAWKTLIHNWVLVEEAQDFQSPRDGFSPTGRPAAVKLWVQNAHKNKIVIPLESRGRFIADWFSWWDHINPDWRQRDPKYERLVIGGTGPWDSMFKPGKCGFLLVIECLVGMHEVACDEDFTDSIQDVGWVMNEILQSLRSRYVVLLLSSAT